MTCSHPRGPPTPTKHSWCDNNIEHPKMKQSDTQFQQNRLTALSTGSDTEHPCVMPGVHDV